jgi:murein DD-endopeptidase MepM/ murein hydrolase activator NlpD
MNDAFRKNKGRHAPVGNGQRTLYTRAKRPAGRFGMGMDRQRAEDRAPMARRTGAHSPWRRPVPRVHALAATGLALTLGLALGLWPEAHSLPEEAPQLAAPVSDPLALTSEAAPDLIPEPATATPAALMPPDPAPETPAWRSLTVRSGESLARIFQREGISARALAALMASGALAKRLADLRPGDQLELQEEDSILLGFRFRPSRLETLTFSRASGEAPRFEAEQELRSPTVSERTAQVVIEDALFLAAQKAGLEDRLALALAEIFQWDIDFVLDIRKGDRFELLYEERALDGEVIGTGAILAARFVNRGEVFEAVRYEDPAGNGSYYTPEGRSLRKAFLRAPVQFTRISSNFNLRRKHPLWNTARPHRGIDYAAPTGTPVVAAGDGKVVKATRNAPSGNYVVLQHGERYQTKYLHLSRFAKSLKAGQRVKQGQVIGYVGSTGWATGPHLHYEFLVGGAHQNPRTVALPKADPIAPEAKADFTRLALARLAALPSAQRLALNGPNPERHETP